MKTAEELYRKHNNITTGFEFKEALEEACKEQREICAEKAKFIKTNTLKGSLIYVDKKSILNAPSPLGGKK